MEIPGAGVRARRRRLPGAVRDDARPGRPADVVPRGGESPSPKKEASLLQTLGQFASLAAISVWKVVPLFKVGSSPPPSTLPRGSASPWS